MRIRPLFCPSCNKCHAGHGASNAGQPVPIRAQQRLQGKLCFQCPPSEKALNTSSMINGLATCRITRDSEIWDKPSTNQSGIFEHSSGEHAPIPTMRITSIHTPIGTIHYGATIIQRISKDCKTIHCLHSTTGQKQVSKATQRKGKQLKPYRNIIATLNTSLSQHASSCSTAQEKHHLRGKKHEKRE